MNGLADSQMTTDSSSKAEGASVRPAPRRLRRVLVPLGLLVILVLLIYTQLAVFVIPPMGALPEGGTLIITRVGNLRFIDSADAVCQREQGGVSLLCRGAVLAAVSSKARVLLHLPYSEMLYLQSTDGRTYDR